MSSESTPSAALARILADTLAMTPVPGDELLPGENAGEIPTEEAAFVSRLPAGRPTPGGSTADLIKALEREAERAVGFDAFALRDQIRVLRTFSPS